MEADYGAPSHGLTRTRGKIILPFKLHTYRSSVSAALALMENLQTEPVMVASATVTRTLPYDMQKHGKG